MTAKRERVEIVLHSGVRAALVALAERTDRPLTEIVNEQLAVANGLDPVAFALPRGRPGRPLTEVAEKRDAGKKTRKNRNLA